MTPAGANSRRRKWWKYLLLTTLTGVLVLAGLGWYVTTAAFQNMVRRRLVNELEKITGGRVELGSIHTSPLRLRVEVRDLTIHGREGAGELPYAHADRVVAEVKIISALGAEFGFHSLVLDHPVVHIIVYPDGTTNQPIPRETAASAGTEVQRVLRLSISRLEVRRGEILWDRESIPLNFVVNDVSADMNYSLLRRRYETDLLLGKVVTRFRDYRPFAWMAEAHLALGNNIIEVRSLKINSGRSHLEGSGRLAGFRDPRIAGIYHATLDLAEVAAIAHSSEVRSGLVAVQGEGTWSAQQFSSSGSLQGRDFDWRQPGLSLNDVSLNTQFTVSSQRLTLTQIQSRLLGGSITGEADVSGWLNPLLLAKNKGKNSQEQKGVVSLKFKDLSLGALATALSTPKRPLQRINLAGTGSGALETRWKGSLQNAETELALQVNAPPSALTTQMPLSGRARGTYRSATRELEVPELSLETRSSQVQASGVLSSSGTLKISASTSDLGEWQRILVGLGERERIPAVLHGHAGFNGSASGRLSNLAIAGNLQVQDFDYLAPATPRTPGQVVHWDSLNADIELSQGGLAVHNGILRHDETTVSFSATTGLDRGVFTAQSRFTAHVDMRNAELAEVLSLAGYNYPVHGTMNLLVDLSGTQAQPRGIGHIQISDGNVYGEPIRAFNAGIRFVGGSVQLTDIALAYYSSSLTGSASYDFSTRAFLFDVSGIDFDLAQLPRIQNSRVAVEGRADFTAQGSGTAEMPVINATLHVRDLTLDRERAGNFTLQATSRGRELHLAGRSQFEPAELTFDGDVDLRGDWLSTLNVHFRQLDVDALLHTYLRGRLTGHSRTSGDLQVKGPLRRPEELQVEGAVSEFYADIEHMKVHNEGTIKFAISSQSLRLDTFRLVGDNTDLSARGTVQLSGERTLDLHAQGSANLKLVQTFDPSFTSSGTVTVDATVSGTFLRPVVEGRVQVNNGALAYLDLTSALSDINGSLTFNQNRLQIESLTAHTGGGVVTFGGNATWYQKQLSFDLTLQEREVRLRYPAGVSSTANADLRFAGTTASSTLSGDVTVTKLSVTPGFDFGAYLASSSRGAVLAPTNPLLSRIRLDVHIVTTPELQMQTAVIRLSGDADLRLRGTAAKPVLLGRADVLEGQVYFNGTKYELERGAVSFTSPVTTTPVLDLQATTHVRDYDITLSVSGEPDKLKVNYRSEPPLPEADIIALLALGRTTQETAQLQQSGESSFTQDASSAIINQALNTTFSNRAQRLFGVSRIKVDPEGLNTETTIGRGPLVTIEQQVSKNLTVTFSTSVEQAAQQIIQVEYNLSRNISIVAIRDQNGVVSFDVRMRRRKR